MKLVLWDVLRANEMTDNYMTLHHSYASLSIHADLYQNIFNIHRISKQQFQNSLQFYQDHPDLLKKILDSLQIYASSKQIFLDSMSKKKLVSADTVLQKKSFKRQQP